MDTPSTFDVGRFELRSAICSLLLSFVAFSILPLSMTDFAPKYIPDKKELTKIYSVEESPQYRSPKNVPGKKQIHTEAFNLGLPIVDKSATFSIDLNPPALAPLPFASFNGVPFGSNLADFEISSGKIDVFELSELDKIPRRIGKVDAVYPESLLRRGIEGQVLLSVVIDEDGYLEVEGVKSATNPLFERAAVETANKLRYEAPLKNGKRVRAKFILPIPFKILK